MVAGPSRLGLAFPAAPCRWSLFISCVGPRARAVRRQGCFFAEAGSGAAACGVRRERDNLRALPCYTSLYLSFGSGRVPSRPMGSTVQSWPASSLRFCLGALRTVVINPKRQNLLHRTVQRRYIPRSCNGSTKRSLYEPLSSHLLHRRVAVLRNGRERHEALRTQ